VWWFHIHRNRVYSVTSTSVNVPLWAPAAAALGILLLARRRAHATGLCDCRYNLSGLPPATPCPECGS
jgi:hypothetical protein